MKKIISKILLIAMLFACVPAGGIVQGSGESIVVNGDFEAFEVGENIATAAQQNTGVFWATSTSVSKITDVFSKSGEKSLKVVHDGSSNEVGINQKVSLKKGKTYRFSAWVRYDPQSPAASNFYIRMSDTTFSWNDRGVSVPLTTESPFTEISALYTPDRDYAAARLNIGMSSKNGAIGYIDDVQCVEVEIEPEPEPEPEGPEMVLDGCFEQASVGHKLGSDSSVRNTFYVGNGTAEVVNTTSYEGENSLKLVGTNPNGDAGLNYIVSLKKGVTYYLSAWVKNGNAVDGNAFYIRFATTSPSTLANSGSLPATNAEWKKIGIYMTFTKDTTERLNLSMSDRDGIGYIDNFSCIEVDPMVTGTNMLMNGSFELDDYTLYDTVTSGSVERSDKYAHRGQYSLKATHDASRPNDEMGINYLGKTLTAGKTYRFGAWIRFDEDEEIPAGVNLQAYVRMMKDSTQLARVNSLPNITKYDDFQFVSALYTPTEKVENVRLNLSSIAKSGVSIYIDDVTFEEVTVVETSIGNLIQGGNFESHQYPFNYLKDDTYAVITDAYKPEYIHSGQYALKVQQLTSSGSVVFPADVLPGETYTFGAWVRFDESVATKNRIYINTRLPGETLAMSDEIDGANGYVYVSKTLVVPEDVTNINFQIKADTGDGSTGKKYIYYVDDVTLVQDTLRCTIGDAKLYKLGETGERELADYTDMTEGVRIFSVTNVENVTTKNHNFAVIAAVYSGNTCIDVNVSNNVVASGETKEEISVTVNIPTGIIEGSIKTFIWDLNTMQPYKKPVKILYVGNSITQHGPNESIGWYGDWGMAASSRDKDYVHTLSSYVNQDQVALDFKYINISQFERSFWDTSGFDKDVKFTTLKDYADIIIFTFGANVDITEHDFNISDYKKIIDYFDPNSRAKIILGSTVLTPSTIVQTIENTALEYGYPYVNMNDMVDAKFFPTKEGFFENASQGVLNHPGDEGMKEMADRLWPKLQKELYKLGLIDKLP